MTHILLDYFISCIGKPYEFRDVLDIVKTHKRIDNTYYSYVWLNLNTEKKLVKRVKRIPWIHECFRAKRNSLLMLQLVHLAQIKWKVHVSQLLELFISMICDAQCFVYSFFSLSPSCHQCIFFSSIIFSIHLTMGIQLVERRKKWVNCDEWSHTHERTNERELNVNEDEQLKNV